MNQPQPHPNQQEDSFTLFESFELHFVNLSFAANEIDMTKRWQKE